MPAYLQRDLDAYKQGVKNASGLLDCYVENYMAALTLPKLMTASNGGTELEDVLDTIAKQQYIAPDRLR